jgi:hypothetical protein
LLLAGVFSVHAEARRLRVLAFDFFFFGTAILSSCWSSAARRKAGTSHFTDRSRSPALHAGARKLLPT